MKKNYLFCFRSLILSLPFLFAGESNSQSAFIGKPQYRIEARRLGNTLGFINVELFPAIAPYHVRNFDSLVTKKFYDTTAFHRVIPGFMIQGGDPNSRSGPTSTWGFGQPGQPTVKAEFSVLKHERGILSAARSSNINSATSQFFICHAAAPNLNGAYSIYGRVISGLSVVDTIATAPRNMQNNMPFQKIEMFITYIGMNDSLPNPAVLQSPPTNTVGVDTTVIALKWFKVPDALLYKVHVSHDSLFSDTVKISTLTGLTYNALKLQPATKFYWKVISNNGGYTAESQVWNFTTASADPGTVTGIKEIRSTEPVRVFPNPGHDKFTFSHVSPGDQLEISDMTGKIIFSTHIKEKSQAIDIGNHAKGTYLYKVRDGQKEISNGKLIVH